MILSMTAVEVGVKQTASRFVPGRTWAPMSNVTARNILSDEPIFSPFSQTAAKVSSPSNVSIRRWSVASGGASKSARCHHSLSFTQAQSFSARSPNGSGMRPAACSAR